MATSSPPRHATARGAGSQPTRRREAPHAPPWLRDRIESEYRAARPFGKPHAHQLDALAEMVIWLSHCYRHHGTEIHRTWPQMVGALEKRGVCRRDGSAYRRDQAAAVATTQRYRMTLSRRLGYLQEMGWVEDFEAQYDDRGEGTGILIRVTAVVAQLAKATAPERSRRGEISNTPQLRRSSISHTLVTPSGVVDRRGGSRESASSQSRGCATRAMGVDGAEQGALFAEGPGAEAVAEGPSVPDLGSASAEGSGSAAAQQGSTGGESGSWGRAAFAAALDLGYDPGQLLADLLESAPDPLLAERELLVAVFERVFSRSARYSPQRWDERLLAALEQLDRYAGQPGAGCAELIELIEWTALQLRPLRPTTPEREEAIARLLGPNELPLEPRALSMFVFHAEAWGRERGPGYRLNRRIARARRLLEAAVDERLDRAAAGDYVARRLVSAVEEHTRALLAEPETAVVRDKQPEEIDAFVEQRLGEPQYVATVAREIVRECFKRHLEQELERRAAGRWCRVRRALWLTDQRFDLGLGLYGADNVRWRKTWRNV